MFIINPSDDSVLTLKPEMTIKAYNEKYTLITYPGISYDPNEKPRDVFFAIDIKYDDIITKLENKDKFIVAQWKEIENE